VYVHLSELSVWTYKRLVVCLQIACTPTVTQSRLDLKMNRTKILVHFSSFSISRVFIYCVFYYLANFHFDLFKNEFLMREVMNELSRWASEWMYGVHACSLLSKSCKSSACSVGWWLMAGAGLFWEKSTASWFWLVAGGWFVLREKYCWLVADKPSDQGAWLLSCYTVCYIWLYVIVFYGFFLSPLLIIYSFKFYFFYTLLILCFTSWIDCSRHARGLCHRLLDTLNMQIVHIVIH
jgi:hypothetical protein